MWSSAARVENPVVDKIRSRGQRVGISNITPSEQLFLCTDTGQELWGFSSITPLHRELLCPDRGWKLGDRQPSLPGAGSMQAGARGVAMLQVREAHLVDSNLCASRPASHHAQGQPACHIRGGHGAMGFTKNPPKASQGHLVLENIALAIPTRFDQRLPPADEEGEVRDCSDPASAGTAATGGQHGWLVRGVGATDSKS